MNLIDKYKYWILAAIAVLILPFYLSSTCIYLYEWTGDYPLYEGRYEHIQTRIAFQDDFYWLGWKACAVVTVIMAAVAITWEFARRK